MTPSPFKNWSPFIVKTLEVIFLENMEWYGCRIKLVSTFSGWMDLFMAALELELRPDLWPTPAYEGTGI